MITSLYLSNSIDLETYMQPRIRPCSDIIFRLRELRDRHKIEALGRTYVDADSYPFRRNYSAHSRALNRLQRRLGLCMA